MKNFRKVTLLSGLFFAVLGHGPARGATTIVSDTYNVTTSGTGFSLNAGINTGINPPTTRLTGTASGNLRYLQTVTSRPASAYDINSSRARVATGNNIGRFTLSANGSAPFDFGPSLGTGYATPNNPIIYDVKISMRNDATGNPRFSLGLATVEGDINNMDFGLQVYRASSGNTFYTLQKRIDRGSFNGTATADATGDLNEVMITTQSGTAATMMDFLIRVTDAGTESGANYNSRIQVSTNNGNSWIYDTSADPAALNRFRFDAAGRYFSFDQAPNTTGTVFYDAFSVTWNSGPRGWTGGGANGNWNTAANWGGAVPASGDKLIFSGTTRQTNTNNLSGLSVPWISFNNGGFALYGNALTVSGAISNSTGNSALNAAVTAGGALKCQSDAGTLTLGGNLTVGANNLAVDGAGNTTASGVISGTGSLTKNGTGTLQLSGASANTLSGNTLVNEGTLSLAKTAGVNAIAGNIAVGDGSGSDVLQLNAANQIADSGSVTISESGTFNLNGFSENVAVISGVSSASQISLGAGTLTVGDASSVAFAGLISGAGNLTKKGSGTLTLSAANTHSGLTTIDAGELIIASGGSIANSSLAINNGAALNVSAISFSVASSKTLECKSTSGKAEILGNVTWNSGAGFSVNANGGGSTIGRLDVAGNITLNSGTVTVNVTGGALNPGTYALITFSGSRSGAFNITPTITGSGLASGLAARITHTSGLVSLHVYNPSWTDTLFKVMHYNVHYATHGGVTDTTTTSQYITNQNIDIVGMNEVDRFRTRSGNRDLPAEYANKTGYSVVFTNASELTGDDETGNAVLSKYPILYRERIFLPQTVNERRCLLKTVVDVKGKFVNFWSTHLDFHADHTERLMAVTNFNIWVQEEIFPTIICGDFNDTPNQPFYDRMEQQWEDAWLEAGDGSLGRTAPCPGYPDNLNARLDYIFRVKGNTLTPTNMIVAYSLEESDHYGVVSRFYLNITTNRSSGFYLPFDEGSGTNVLDTVGGLKGTLGTGAPAWNASSPSGLPGDSSLYFNGTKKLTITDTKQNIGTNGVDDSYTLQAWVKVAVNYAPAQRAILFQYDRKPGFSFSINTNRTLHTTAFKVQDVSSSATLPNDGQWHHVAVVHTDGVNMKFYIDGSLSATVAYTGGAGYRTSANITVGSADDGANPFTGYLARVKFDNRALTAAQLDTVAAPQGDMAPSIASPFESWMAAHGITDANADDDGDGQKNFAEFAANTDPKDAASLLQIISAKRHLDGQVELTWTSIGGVRYRVQFADAINGEFNDIVRDSVAETDSNNLGESSTQSFSDSAPANAVRFYRVRVIQG